MPTQPYEPLLDRDTSKIKFIVDTVCPVLQETVNHATNFYQRCQTSQECASDESFPALAMYLHIIQMIDSIEVLISNGCVEPANLLLRSAFEAKLGIGYLLEKNRGQRAISWIVKNIIDEIENLQTIDLSNKKNKESAVITEPDVPEKIIKVLPTPSISEDIVKLRENLKKPAYAEAYAEYSILMKKGRKYPEWYSFFGGPRNLKELATYLNQIEIYQRLYSSWSRISHVSDAQHLTFPLEGGRSVLGPIRNPVNSIHVGTMALSWVLETTSLMVRAYRPYESSKFSKWLKKEVRDKHILLVRLEMDHLKWFDEKFMPKEKNIPKV